MPDTPVPFVVEVRGTGRDRKGWGTGASSRGEREAGGSVAQGVGDAAGQALLALRLVEAGVGLEVLDVGRDAALRLLDGLLDRDHHRQVEQLDDLLDAVRDRAADDAVGD